MTAAANGKRQRPATAQHTRTIRGNSGYVRPEKRKVGGSTPPLTATSDQFTRFSASMRHPDSVPSACQMA